MQLLYCLCKKNNLHKDECSSPVTFTSMWQEAAFDSRHRGDIPTITDFDPHHIPTPQMRPPSTANLPLDPQGQPPYNGTPAPCKTSPDITPAWLTLFNSQTEWNITGIHFFFFRNVQFLVKSINNGQLYTKKMCHK